MPNTKTLILFCSVGIKMTAWGRHADVTAAASICINQHQSITTGTNQHQSASFGINQHQSESINQSIIVNLCKLAKSQKVVDAAAFNSRLECVSFNTLQSRAPAAADGSGRKQLTLRSCFWRRKLQATRCGGTAQALQKTTPVQILVLKPPVGFW